MQRFSWINQYSLVHYQEKTGENVTTLSTALIYLVANQIFLKRFSKVTFTIVKMPAYRWIKHQKSHPISLLQSRASLISTIRWAAQTYYPRVNKIQPVVRP
jgi:hypothetical protein